MQRRLTTTGDLKFGNHKTIHCNVQLCVDTIEEDDWAKPSTNYNPDNYIDGVRITGEASFESFPLNDVRLNHPIKSNAVGELTVHNGDESSKLNVLMVERTGVVDIVPKKLVRYFWLFFVVGKPSWDKLGLFPKNYRGVVNMNRIYACTDFRGYWPVGVASVIVASDKNEAKTLLNQKLKNAGIPLEGDGDYTLTEIDIEQKGALILNNGDWQ